MSNDSAAERRYQSGFGNEHASEAVAGALPRGRNSPQRAPFDLYPELISGTAFTAPRHENRRSWMYRRQPSVVSGRYEAYAQPTWQTGPDRGVALAPEPMRWHPIPFIEAETDFVDGMHTLAANGDVEAQQGVAAHVYLANKSMQRRAFVNADGELLVVPQEGRLLITTEMGVLDVKPGEIALLPRGVVFKVALPDSEAGAGPSRGYVCENYGAQFRLPELGPIGSNGLANARDFQAPVAAFESETGGYELVKKSGGRLWRAPMKHSPFNVVAWHGNLAPVKYDTAHFMTIGSISFDHPVRQRGHERRGKVHRIGLLQADQPQLQGERTEQIVATGAVLLDQPEPAEADQVGVRLGGRHVGLPREILQRHRPAVVHQCAQQLAAHLDALDAALRAISVVSGHDPFAVCSCRRH